MSLPDDEQDWITMDLLFAASHEATNIVPTPEWFGNERLKQDFELSNEIIHSWCSFAHCSHNEPGLLPDIQIA